MVPTDQCACVLDSGKATRMTDHPNTSLRRMLVPEDSDFLPSVSLAAVLVLVFISVLPMLLQPDTGYEAVRTLASVRGNIAHFRPLLYGQPLSTQLTVERLNKIGDQVEVITVLAVAEEDAFQTLVCFSSKMVSLLSKQGQVQSVIKQVWGNRPLAATWNNSAVRLSKFFSVAVITQRTGQNPHCAILGPPNPVTGDMCLMEISLPSSPSERSVTMRRESRTIADQLLQHLYRTALVPESFEIREPRRQQLGVIHIKGDPYLERGMVVC
ncbi:uncharacterized protein LOC134947407 [Pseudophryne corroboree]|uniref:uncharacterized protein LOC134947407 n=1 Tax=Pseudophryne corroboree TaxID=495146 RepID=UPI003081A772